MINWTIKIFSPTITQGMSFQVKYRKLPSTTWVPFLPNPTSNEFTITNLEEGSYEAEIRTVCANGEISNPVYHSTANVPQACAIVTDLSFTENVVAQNSYMYRSFTFNWTRANGSTYRLEFQKDGVNIGFNDNASGINSNTPVTVYGINPDKVRVVTICPDNEVNSAWLNIPVPSTYPTSTYYFQSIHADGHAGDDKIVYKDASGIIQEQILERAHWEEDPYNPGQDIWVEATCHEIIASEIVAVHGASTCLEE